MEAEGGQHKFLDQRYSHCPDANIRLAVLLMRRFLFFCRFSFVVVVVVIFFVFYIIIILFIYNN